MRSLLARVHALGLAVLVLTASLLRAREIGPALDVHTATGQTVFHLGERIPLKLTFTSPNDTQYAIAPCCNDRADRGGEFSFESVAVVPSTGWFDPLATYLAQDRPMMGHGWSWPLLLKSKPVEVSINLNEFIRFDQPGVYRVKIISHRVSSADRKGLRSVIELHIIPATPEWQDAKLKAILAHAESDEDANADLRYLATPAAIDEMTNRLREGYAFPATECSMGLVGLPDSMHDVAIALMNRRIDEPDFPISTLFFTTMSLLHVSPDSNGESIRQQRQSIDAALWQRVFSSVPKKEPAPRAETVQTLLSLARKIKTSEMQTQIGLLLSASFPNLDDLSQLDDLRQHWDLLHSPDILPALQNVAKRPTANYGLPGRNASEDLKSAAFKRWYELDPVGAQTEILAQIGSSTPTLSAQAVAFMPAGPLPQFESLWAEAFVRTGGQLQEETLGSLLVRFGTGAATQQMIARLREPPGTYDCMARSLALAYLVRFSPDDARPLLRHEIAADLTRCNDSLLQRISEHATGPVLNEIAFEVLDNGARHAGPNTQVIVDAIQYLKSYGTKSDEKAIWNRYVRWTKEWSSKAYILDHPGPGLHQCGEVCIGDELGEALIANQGWFADHALISRVLRRCVGKEMCKELRDVARSAAPPYQVFLPDPSSPSGINVVQSYNVAQYAPKSRDLLAAKIGQYPPGTKFVLVRPGPVNEDQRKLEDEVQALFKKTQHVTGKANKLRVPVATWQMVKPDTIHFTGCPMRWLAASLFMPLTGGDAGAAVWRLPTYGRVPRGSPADDRPAYPSA